MKNFLGLPPSFPLALTFPFMVVVIVFFLIDFVKPQTVEDWDYCFLRSPFSFLFYLSLYLDYLNSLWLNLSLTP